MSGYYQRAPEGVWRSSPERILLWAVESTLHRITRDIPESKQISKWQRKIENALLEPVRKYDWAALWREKQLAKAKGDESAPDVPKSIMQDWEETIGAIITGAKGLWQDAAGVRTSAEGLPFDAADLEEAMAATMDLVKSIPQTAHDRLRALMRDAYDEGKNQTGFADMIRDGFKGISKAKAEQIAVTEWNRAASQATLIGYKRTGVQQKRWYTAGDDRVCEVCEANAAEAEIPIDQEFFSGDQTPPAHPGCRCNIAGA